MDSERRRPRVFTEGPAAAQDFDDALRHILTIDKPELDRREAEYQQERATRDRPGARPGRNYRRKTA